MLITLVFSIDEDVVKIYYHENTELFRQNLVNIALKHGQYIGQFKKYYLVLKVAIISSEDRLPFIFFSNLHLMVSINQVKLGKMPSLA